MNDFLAVVLGSFVGVLGALAVLLFGGWIIRSVRRIKWLMVDGPRCHRRQCRGRVSHSWPVHWFGWVRR